MGGAGRPRSEESHKAILQAAYDLLAEGGFAEFTIERVAARAGVSRSTIYRWWPSKGALAMESTLGALVEAVKFRPGPSPVENIRTRMRLVVHALQGRTGRIVAGMLAEGQHDRETIASFTTGYLEPARQITRDLIHQAIEGGCLPGEFDVEMAIDVSFGALYHQLLLQRTMDEAWVDRLTVFVFGDWNAGT